MAPEVTGPLPFTAQAAATAILVAAVVATSLAPAVVVANEESKALMAFRNGIQDPGGYLWNWDPNDMDPCTWIRVECSNDNRVTRLEFVNLNLIGPLAPELGKLEQLQYMEMFGNSLQGPIPPEFGNLTNLIAMDLYRNNISGHIPSTLGNLKSLNYLRMDHNRLTGPIPTELTGLTNLLDINLSNNDLCGTIPTSDAFDRIPHKNFDNNPRLKQPGTEGSGGGDDSNC